MRKVILGALCGALFFAFAAVAWALTDNEVDYSSTVDRKGKTPKGQPGNMEYNGVLAISTSSGGQPNTAPLAEIFFAKEIKNNARKFPACDTDEIDGQTEFPKKCNKAVIGGGTAHAEVGSPGQSGGIPQDLQVTAVNGDRGRNVLLALSGGALPGIRVIPGAIRKTNEDGFGTVVGFEVPEELQEICLSPGNCRQIALTNFDVTVDTKKKVKVKYGKAKRNKKGKKVRKSYKASYLQLKKCPSDGQLAVRATIHFDNDDGSEGGPVISDDSVSNCTT